MGSRQVNGDLVETSSKVSIFENKQWKKTARYFRRKSTSTITSDFVHESPVASPFANQEIITQIKSAHAPSTTIHHRGASRETSSLMDRTCSNSAAAAVDVCSSCAFAWDVCSNFDFTSSNSAAATSDRFFISASLSRRSWRLSGQEDAKPVGTGWKILRAEAGI